ncbi:hypothetical protein WS62_15125 [Burkholderia sp. ABCPW 14]|uniref:hypothetical protein n=1 Tax=Burkholderia sp. ABCPW 14 TaxID=1637860 RepID=UPI000770C2C2|nr:hypothetical protein [Burkholderia sp. ABCPW 14]KVD89534.1 hypothetical protein WS62_15125 [Burkholderia sp. ABCPW 14]
MPLRTTPRALSGPRTATAILQTIGREQKRGRARRAGSDTDADADADADADTDTDTDAVSGEW